MDCFHPTIWARDAKGYRIENLQTVHFPHILQMIQHYYLSKDALMTFTKFAADARSVEKFLAHCESIMLENCSLVLIDDHQDEIVGCVLLSVVDKMEFGRRFSCVRFNDPESYTKVIELKNSMQKKIDYFNDYGVNTLMRFYLICIVDQHRGHHLGLTLIRAGLEVTRHLNISLAVTFMSNMRGVEMAKHCGFNTVDFLPYNDVSKMHPTNYVTLMVCKVPPLNDTHDK